MKDINIKRIYINLNLERIEMYWGEDLVFSYDSKFLFSSVHNKKLLNESQGLRILIKSNQVFIWALHDREIPSLILSSSSYFNTSISRVFRKRVYPHSIVYLLREEEENVC